MHRVSWGSTWCEHAWSAATRWSACAGAQSVDKLEGFKDRITVIPGMTNDRRVIQQAVAGCDGVLTVLVPWGREHYSSGTAQAVLDYSQPGRG